MGAHEVSAAESHPLLTPVSEAELFKIAITHERRDLINCLHVERVADVFSVKLLRAGREMLYLCCATCGLEALRISGLGE